MINLNTFSLFRAQYTSYPVDVSITNVQIETALPYDSGMGLANFVEQCICPKGYTGLSCEVSIINIWMLFITPQLVSTQK